MEKLQVTLYECFERLRDFAHEIPGEADNALVMAMLRLYNDWPTHDEIPWCSAAPQLPCLILGLPHSKQLNARSWHNIGLPVPNLLAARRGFDIVILKRSGTDGLGGGEAGPEDKEGPGHLTLFSRYEVEALSETDVRHWFWGLGGNQHNRIDLSRFPAERILWIRRLFPT